MNKHLIATFSLLLFLCSCKTDPRPTPPQEDATTALLIESANIERKQGDCEGENGKCAHVGMSYPIIKKGPAALQKNVATWANDFLISLLDPSLELDAETSLSSAMDGFFTMHEEITREMPELTANYEVEVTDTVLFQNDKYLTLRMDAYSYTGGAHPNSVAAIATFDLETGKRLRPIDLVKDLEKLYEQAEGKFRETQREAFEDGFHFTESWPFTIAENVGLTTDGLFFCYVPYEVAPYAMGFTEFVIPYAQLEMIGK